MKQLLSIRIEINARMLKLVISLQFFHLLGLFPLSLCCLSRQNINKRKVSQTR